LFFQATNNDIFSSQEHAGQLHRDHPELYKDPNHKPELAIALTPFEALCGFRPINEIKDYLQSKDFFLLEAVILDMSHNSYYFP